MLNMARRRAGLTQRELSRLTGVPQPSISRIERGVVSPTVDMLERLVRACGMELEPVGVPGENDLDWTLIDELLEMRTPARAAYVAATGREIGRIMRTARPVA